MYRSLPVGTTMDNVYFETKARFDTVKFTLIVIFKNNLKSQQQS